MILITGTYIRDICILVQQSSAATYLEKNIVNIRIKSGCCEYLLYNCLASSGDNNAYSDIRGDGPGPAGEVVKAAAGTVGW